MSFATEILPKRPVVEEDGILLLPLIEARSPKLIAIDGAMGAGKTTLGKTLARHLQWRHIDLDEYLAGGICTYLDKLNYDALKDDLNVSSPVILSGVFILNVLERLSKKPDLKIYVVSTSREGIPSDLGLFDADLLQEQSEFGQCMHGDLQQYYYDYRPITNADAFFVRTEDEDEDLRLDITNL